jgi:hypothetical protein
MNICPECYSADNRITPLLEPRNCLENHTQYICGTCGRCICIDKDEKREVQRWKFPFRTLDIAKLYLRTADVSTKTPCGIYEITGNKGRKSFKIFAGTDDLLTYLAKNKDKTCEQMKPLFQQESFHESPKAQIRKLSQQEVETYLQEQNSTHI